MTIEVLAKQLIELRNQVSKLQNEASNRIIDNTSAQLKETVDKMSTEIKLLREQNLELRNIIYSNLLPLSEKIPESVVTEDELEATLNEYKKTFDTKVDEYLIQRLTRDIKFKTDYTKRFIEIKNNFVSKKDLEGLVTGRSLESLKAFMLERYENLLFKIETLESKVNTKFDQDKLTNILDEIKVDIARELNLDDLVTRSELINRTESFVDRIEYDAKMEELDELLHKEEDMTPDSNNLDYYTKKDIDIKLGRVLTKDEANNMLSNHVSKSQYVSDSMSYIKVADYNKDKYNNIKNIKENNYKIKSLTEELNEHKISLINVDRRYNYVSESLDNTLTYLDKVMYKLDLLVTDKGDDNVILEEVKNMLADFRVRLEKLESSKEER